MEHRTERRQVLHHVATTTERADGQATADHLAETREVGPHVEASLGTRRSESEPGDDFVEDEKRAHSVACRTESGEETGSWRDHTHVGGHRFDDHRGHRVVEIGDLVVRRDDRVGHCFGRHAGSPGQTERRHTTSAGGEQRVGCAVEVAVEDHHARTTRRTTRETYRGRRGFGTRVHEANPLTRRNARGDRFGEFHLTRGGRSVRRAVAGRLAQRLGDRRVGVSEDHRAVTLHEIDVRTTFDVFDPCAVGAGDDVGRTAHGLERTDRRIHTTGYGRLRTFEEGRVRRNTPPGAHDRIASGAHTSIRIAVRDVRHVVSRSTRRTNARSRSG